MQIAHEDGSYRIIGECFHLCSISLSSFVFVYFVVLPSVLPLLAPPIDTVSQIQGIIEAEFILEPARRLRS